MFWNHSQNSFLWWGLWSSFAGWWLSTAVCLPQEKIPIQKFCDMWSWNSHSLWSATVSEGTVIHPSFLPSVLPSFLPPSCLLVLWETHVEGFSFHREWWPSLFTEFSKLMWSVSNSWVWIRYCSFSVSNGKNLFHKQEYKSSSQFLHLNLFILITWLFH